MSARGILSSLAAVSILILGISTSTSTVIGQCNAQQIAKINDSNPASQYFFGHSVAIDGDVAVIGAYRDWSAGHEAGAVFVFRYDGNDWIEEAKLMSSDIADDDEFGASVDVSGNTIVVGANFDDDGGLDSGSAYVFEFNGSGWDEKAKLTASDAWAFDNFGFSVSIDGDFILVGANLEDAVGANSGSAYLFKKRKNGWRDMTESVKLVSSDLDTNDEFGKSVSISGGTAVIGAHFEAGGSANQGGSAYVFQDSGSGWTQVAKLTASDAGDMNRLGFSVAIDGDLVVCGAHGNSAAVPQSGAAYLFEKPLGGWADMTQTAKFTASDAETGDRFGWSVAVNGSHVIIGAPAHLWDGSGFGAAYVFDKPTGGWEDSIETARYIASDSVEDDAYAVSVSASGYRAVVGASFHRTADYYGAGASYILGGLADCQPNSVLDTCDIAGGTSFDADGNGVPDECEATGDGSGTVSETLIAGKSGEDDIALFWDVSCIGTDNDYAVYEGVLGDFSSHSARFCSTGGDLRITFPPTETDAYYLVVPRNALREGSYGQDGDGHQRPVAVSGCLLSVPVECP